jgi:hypothetical protein
LPNVQNTSTRMYQADGESQQNVNVLLNQNNLFRYVEMRSKRRKLSRLNTTI